jgi:hypothetical protein
MLFPEQAIDYRKDIGVIAARRWPTVLTKADFKRVTGETDFPEYLSPNVTGGQLNYYCNTLVSYTLRGVHTKLNVIWNYEAPAGTGDTHFAVFKGSKARIEVRQGKEEKYRPELYVVPNSRAQRNEVLAGLSKKVSSLQTKFPDIAYEERGEEFRLTIPDKYRVGHEEHFAQVTERFLGYFKNPKSLPAWERPNMLAKYYVTTKGVELSRQSQ